MVSTSLQILCLALSVCPGLAAYSGELVEDCFIMRLERRRCQDDIVQSTPKGCFTCDSMEKMLQCSKDLVITDGCLGSSQRELLLEKAFLALSYPDQNCSFLNDVKEMGVKRLVIGKSSNCSVSRILNMRYRISFCADMKNHIATSPCSGLESFERLCLEKDHDQCFANSYWDKLYFELEMGAYFLQSLANKWKSPMTYAQHCSYFTERIGLMISDLNFLPQKTPDVIAFVNISQEKSEDFFGFNYEGFVSAIMDYISHQHISVFSYEHILAYLGQDQNRTGYPVKCFQAEETSKENELEKLESDSNSYGKNESWEEIPRKEDQRNPDSQDIGYNAPRKNIWNTISTLAPIATISNRSGPSNLLDPSYWKWIGVLIAINGVMFFVAIGLCILRHIQTKSNNNNNMNNVLS